MTSLIVADDFIGAPFIQDGQLGNFLLDRAHPSEERMDVWQIHALSAVDKRDLGLVLARGETTCSAAKRAVRCDTNAGLERCHDNPRNRAGPEISLAGLPLRATRGGSDRPVPAALAPEPAPASYRRQALPA